MKILVRRSLLLLAVAAPLSPSLSAFDTTPRIAVLRPGSGGPMVRCDPRTGTCKQPQPTGDCDDRNACTIDFSDPAAGCRHTPLNCADSDPRTVDLCDPSSGCIYLIENPDPGSYAAKIVPPTGDE